MNLALHEPFNKGRAFIADLTHQYGVTDFARGVDIRGGAFDGAFDITAAPAELQRFFNSYIGHEVRENKTLCFMIREMELTLDGTIRRISLDNVANAVRSRYTDSNGDQVFTAWQENSESIQQYGRIEKDLVADFDASSAEALQTAKIYLRSSAWPRSIPIRFNVNRPDGLRVEVVGYKYLLRWISVSPITSTTASSFVTSIANDTPGLSAGRIDTNSLTVTSYQQDGLRTMEAICNLGDSSLEPWTFTIDENLKLHYHPVSSEFTYRYMNHRFFDLNNSQVAIDPRAMRPAVIRMMDFQAAQYPEQFLTDARDILLTRIEVDRDGNLDPRPGGVDPVDILEAQSKRNLPKVPPPPPSVSNGITLFGEGGGSLPGSSSGVGLFGD